MNLVTRTLRSISSWSRHDLHSTTTISPLRDRRVATSGTACAAPDNPNDTPRYREREFNTLRFRAKFLFSEKILWDPSAPADPYVLIRLANSPYILNGASTLLIYPA